MRHLMPIVTPRLMSHTLGSGAASAIFVCGMLHLRKPADKFTSEGCEVRQISICETEWYTQNYGTLKLFTDIDGNLWHETRFASPKSIH
jgi:hypothetical protein